MTISNEQPEIMRGHLGECFKHFRTALQKKYPSKGKESGRGKEAYAKFCGINVPSLNNWLRHDGTMPVGAILVKVTCLMDLLGYRIIEWDRLKSGRRRFAELIGYGLIDSVQATRITGFDKSSRLYPILSGQENTTDAKDQLMWDAWLERKDALEERKNRARKIFGLLLPTQPAPANDQSAAYELVPPENPVEKEVSETRRGARQLAMLSLIHGMSLLFEEGFYNLSEKELSDLSNADRYIIAEFTAHLNNLSAKLTRGQSTGAGHG